MVPSRRSRESLLEAVPLRGSVVRRRSPPWCNPFSPTLAAILTEVALRSFALIDWVVGVDGSERRSGEETRGGNGRGLLRILMEATSRPERERGIDLEERKREEGFRPLGECKAKQWPAHKPQTLVPFFLVYFIPTHFPPCPSIFHNLICTTYAYLITY